MYGAVRLSLTYTLFEHPESNDISPEDRYADSVSIRHDVVIRQFGHHAPGRGFFKGEDFFFAAFSHSELSDWRCTGFDYYK